MNYERALCQAQFTVEKYDFHFIFRDELVQSRMMMMMKIQLEFEKIYVLLQYTEFDHWSSGRWLGKIDIFNFTPSVEEI